MSQTTQRTEEDKVDVSTGNQSGDGDSEPGDDEREKLSFDGSYKDILAITATGVGGAAALYVFGIVIAIAVLAAAVIVIGLYLRYKRKIKLA